MRHALTTGYLSLVLLIMSAGCFAHDGRPILVDIHEASKLVQVSIKAPSSLALEKMPQVLLPDTCAQFSSGPTIQQMRSNIVNSKWLCETSLSNQVIKLDYPGSNPSLSSLIKFQSVHGLTQSTLLGPQQTSWQVPADETVSAVVGQYILMGAQHILVGLDHLLFVACLLILAKSFRRSVLTITGFTLGHSITLVAATLGYVSVPVSLFEALIGLSIVFLVIEIFKQDHRSWTFKYPMLVSVVFGLIHGLGFASVLGEVGLPQAQMLWGLVAFNIGIELGQLLFVGGLLVLAEALKRASKAKVQQQLRHVFLYGIAYLSAFWFWERSFGFLIQGLV